jgi:hypothetical protein
MLTFILGAIAGAIVIGFIANRRPLWFAHVVTAANSVDAKVNSTASAIVTTQAAKLP